MIVPNKIVTLQESALGLSPRILRCGPNPRSLAGLYQELADEFEGIDEFLLTIDLLYVLGRVDVDMDTGVLSYVEEN